MIATIMKCSGDGGINDGDADSDTDGDTDGDVDANTSDPMPKSALTAEQEYTEVLCGCFATALGYMDEVQCLARESRDTHSAACFETAYATHEAAVEETLRCNMGIHRWLTECISETGCDLVQGQACLDEAEDIECPELTNADATDYQETLLSCILGAPSPCPENPESVSNTGAAVFSGDTTAAGDDYTLSCGVCDMWGYCSEDSADRAFQWTAPRDGTFVIDTMGSMMPDTILGVFDACHGDETACNDNAADETLQSSLEVTVTTGQTIIIVVTSYNLLGYGPFVVNINPA